MRERGKRIIWIDVAKALAMICVIIGHKSSNGVVNGVIYSFHMPVFFILNALTTQMVGNVNEFKSESRRTIKRLLPIYVLVFCVGSIFYENKNLEFVKERLLSFLFASGAPVQIGGGIQPIGVMWFLVVLVESKMMFQLFKLWIRNEIKLMVVIALITSAGMLLGNYGIWLPFSLDIALVVVCFMAIGDAVKRRISTLFHQAIIVVLMVFGWGLTLGLEFLLMHKQFNLAYRQYPLYWISIVTAVCGAYLLGYIAFSIENYLPAIKNILARIGKNTLLILIVHNFDSKFIPAMINDLPQFLSISLIVGIDILIAYFAEVALQCFKNTLKIK